MMRTIGFLAAVSTLLSVASERDGRAATSPPPDQCVLNAFTSSAVGFKLPAASVQTDGWGSTSTRRRGDQLKSNASIWEKVTSVGVIANESDVSLYLFENEDMTGRMWSTTCPKGKACLGSLSAFPAGTTFKARSMICQREYWDDDPTKAPIPLKEAVAKIKSEASAALAGIDFVKGVSVTANWVTGLTYCAKFGCGQNKDTEQYRDSVVFRLRATIDVPLWIFSDTVYVLGYYMVHPVIDVSNAKKLKIDFAGAWPDASDCAAGEGECNIVKAKLLPGLVETDLAAKLQTAIYSEAKLAAAALGLPADFEPLAYRNRLTVLYRTGFGVGAKQANAISSPTVCPSSGCPKTVITMRIAMPNTSELVAPDIVLNY